MRPSKLLLAAALLAPVAGLALDLPHAGANLNSNTCYSCHKPHGATGTGLTYNPLSPTDSSNSGLCLSCHTANGGAWINSWKTSHQATPNSGGRSHHWDSNTTNSAYGASPPTDSGLLARTPGGIMMCSTCHDQHGALQASRAPQNAHISTPSRAAAVTTYVPTITMTSSLAANTTTAAVAQGYHVAVNAASSVQVTHPLNAVATTTTYAVAAAGTVQLSKAGDDPVVSVYFNQAPSATDATNGVYWDFWVGYPFPRMAVGEAEMCLNCHADRNQQHGLVEGGTSGYGWGGKAYSHPVAEAMGANGKSYDFSTPIDANGATTAAGFDGNPSNDLVLSPTSKVTCLTCHAIHNTDSNSQTVDAH